MPTGYYHGGFAPGVGILGIVMFLIFWAAVALLVVSLTKLYRRGPRHVHHHSHGHSPEVAHLLATHDPAIELLKERFARGEINAEEFSRRIALLKQS